MTIYYVERIMMKNLTCNAEHMFDEITRRFGIGFYADLNCAQNYIYSEIQRINKDRIKKEGRINVQELKATRDKAQRTLCVFDCSSISNADWIYRCPTAVDDGSYFLFTITEVDVEDRVEKPYRGRKIIFQ